MPHRESRPYITYAWLRQRLNTFTDELIAQLDNETDTALQAAASDDLRVRRLVALGSANWPAQPPSNVPSHNRPILCSSQTLRTG